MINKFIEDMSCPYCGINGAMKFLPTDSNYITLQENATFCSECGRHYIVVPKQEKQIA